VIHHTPSSPLLEKGEGGEAKPMKTKINQTIPIVTLLLPSRRRAGDEVFIS